MDSALTNLLLGAGLNLVVALAIVRGIYYPVTQDRSYVFSFLAFNTVIYFVLGLLSSVELSIGIGFGLFAIFSVLRYRTAEMPIREMTYLFIVIALPVMNSVLIQSGEFLELIIANILIVVMIFILERGWGFHFEMSKRIIYEKIELITPAHHDQLLADLRERTGLPVNRVAIESIDFLRDIVYMTIYYDKGESHSVVADRLEQLEDLPAPKKLLAK